MRIRSILLVVSALVVGLVVAGCGGGSDSSSSTTGASGASGATGASGAPLSKSEFVAKANAICKQGNDELNKAQPASSSQADQEKFVTDTVIPNIQKQIDGVDALTPPAGDEDQVNAFITAAQSALDKVKADPSLLTQQSGTDPFAQANKLTNAYGLTECGGG